MARRTLDFIFSAGALGLAALLLILGLVMTSNADFSKDYVGEQLGQQHITFTPLAGLDEVERKSECLVANAGRRLETGKQAECYANDYIGLHLQSTADGQTFADLGTRITAATAARESLFKGETLRGLLLTSFGFSVFGVKGGQVATVSFIVAGLLALLSLAGLAHALKTSKDTTFAAPTYANGKGNAAAADKPVVVTV